MPTPPAGVGSLEGGRCYIRFTAPQETARAREVFHGRTFDGNSIKASFVSEADYAQAEAGAWLPAKQEGASPAPAAAPAMPTMPAMPVMPSMPMAVPAGAAMPGVLPGPPVMPALPAGVPGDALPGPPPMPGGPPLPEAL